MEPTLTNAELPGRIAERRRAGGPQLPRSTGRCSGPADKLALVIRAGAGTSTIDVKGGGPGTDRGIGNDARPQLGRGAEGSPWG
ncbi:hypothetical protein HBB16_20165 [Pseudonocardia sp. MCCB 268]|nr:hypothetical protein [Pseudonocardia cytotoxica]